MLSYIGYDISYAIKNSKKFDNLIFAYSCHFQSQKDKSQSRKNILKHIEIHFINILLTKFIK